MAMLETQARDRDTGKNMTQTSQTGKGPYLARPKPHYNYTRQTLRCCFAPPSMRNLFEGGVRGACA